MASGLDLSEAFKWRGRVMECLSAGPENGSAAACRAATATRLRQALGGRLPAWARTIAAVQPNSWDPKGAPSLEMRWIFPGQLPTAMAGWLERYPAHTTALQDAYLVDPYLPGLSVKVREGQALEVKAYRGSPGLLEAEQAIGRLESWRKYRFPWDSPSQENDDPAVWRTVTKTRRISRFCVAGGLIEARVPEPGQGPGCAMELTQIRTQGQAWWTLGFEATGPVDALPGEFEAAAALVFARPLPAGVELGMGDCMSYAQWLHGHRPG